MSGGPRAGFTFIEALITLVIAGLILTAVFDLSRRMTADAGSLEGRLRSVVNEAREEALLRQVLGSFVVPPLEVLPDTVEKVAFSGTATAIGGTLSSIRPIPCLPGGGTFPVELTLRPAEGGTELVCTRGRQTQVLHRFESTEVRLSYLDPSTGAVAVVWPPADSAPEDVLAENLIEVSRPRDAAPRVGLPPMIMLQWSERGQSRTVMAAGLASGPFRPVFDETRSVSDIP